MRHEPSVFGALVNDIPWGVFDRLVKARDAERGLRTFGSRDHLIAMLGSALGGLNGLRQTTAGLAPGRGALRLMGGAAPHRSTLADANRQRDPALFFDLFQAMLPCLHRTGRRAMGEVVRLIDSTQVNLGLRMRQWVGLHRSEPTAKIHVVHDPRAGQPTYFAITAAKVSDIKAARDLLPIEPGATYVFDLGYYDFAWWAKLRDQGCRFVTRLKSNTKLREAECRAVAAEGTAEGTIVSDRTAWLPERLAGYHHNPFGSLGREVVVTISRKRTLRLFTNDLQSSAEAIASLYKERWQIELFLKWIKQNLKIARFMGTTENAVRIQVATALIAYLLIRLAQAKLAVQHQACTILTIVKGQMFTRIPLAFLLDPPPTPRRRPQPQLAFLPAKI